jgi:arylsulfatase A-like enzyme
MTESPMNMISQHSLFSRNILVGLTIAAALAILPDARAEAAQPNILLIMVDDLGYGDLSSYGATDLESPNIDRLISEGMRFTNFYANCPVCSPTRAATMTGRYPDLVGVPGVIRTHADNNWGYLSPAAKLLPELLSTVGYDTALIGKWHLGLEPENHPRSRGFDVFHGYLGDMMDDYFHHRRHGNNYMRRNLEEIDPAGHATDLFTQWTIDTIKDRQENKTPWFVFLSYNAPHTPIQPPRDWLEKTKKRQPEMSQQRAKLVALIEHLDAGIGKVLGALEETGQTNDTIVVFVSDNGGQLSVGASCGSLRGGKQDMYEGGIRVPAAVRWPGHVEPGSESDHVALTMDLLPTLCEAASAAVNHPIDGSSLLPLMQGKTITGPPRTLFFVRREGGARYEGQEHYAVRQGDWKLLHNTPPEPYELYNLKNDPQETKNLAAAEEAVYNQLTQKLRAHIQRAGVVPWQSP